MGGELSFLATDLWIARLSHPTGDDGRWGYVNRFVVLHHSMPPSADRPDHWDFMLERGDILATWAVEALPLSNEAVDAIKLTDHRLSYLDYEGPVSGNRGEVTRWDFGDYRSLEISDGLVRVELRGQILTGRATLWQTGKDQSWQFIYEPD